VHSIIHEFTAPYSSAQNGLAERAIRTTMDDVRTLLYDSGLGHLPTENPSLVSHPRSSGSDDLVDLADLVDPADLPPPIASAERAPGLRRSARVPQPSSALLESRNYQQRESEGRGEGLEWATARKHPQASFAFDRMTIDIDDYVACLADTKASHQIPRSYRHAMATDPNRWMVPMTVEMDTLTRKHTWDLVKPPEGANIMDSMWVYDIKWDGEGNRIKDKARLVGKGYTQQLGVDYNETWAGVTRLESVRMTAAIAAKLDLHLWRIDFVGAYLNSLTKEDIYMKQPEGFVKPGFEDYVCKLVHTIYGTMQGAHDWYETLTATYNKLDYITSHADPCV